MEQIINCLKGAGDICSCSKTTVSITAKNLCQHYFTSRKILQLCPKCSSQSGTVTTLDSLRMDILFLFWQRFGKKILRLHFLSFQKIEDVQNNQHDKNISWNKVSQLYWSIFLIQTTTSSTKKFTITFSANSVHSPVIFPVCFYTVVKKILVLFKLSNNMQKNDPEGKYRLKDLKIKIYNMAGRQLQIRVWCCW